jgi:hypothetical protein
MDLTKWSQLEAVLPKLGKSHLSDEELGLVFSAYNLLFPTQTRQVTRCGSCVREVSQAVVQNRELLKILLV